MTVTLRIITEKEFPSEENARDWISQQQLVNHGPEVYLTGLSAMEPNYMKFGVVDVVRIELDTTIINTAWIWPGDL